jgi:hypothetical protein
MPEDFPEYPGSTLGERFPLKVEKGAIGSWTTDASTDEVTRFFQDSLPAHGYAVERVVRVGRAVEVRFQKADGSDGRLSEIDIRERNSASVTTILVMIGVTNDPIVQRIR